MRITVTIDDDLYEKARELSGPSLENSSDLVHASIATYVRVKEAKRLAALGGQAPEMQDIPRRGKILDLNEHILECLKVKEGSKEFALFYRLDGENEWVAMLGNESPFALGESKGEFIGKDCTPIAAIGRLYDNILCGNLNNEYDWILYWDRTPWLEGFNIEGRKYTFDDEDKLFDDLMVFMQSKEK